MADHGDTVRATAPDRYFAALYAPEDARRDLFTLYAFDAEIASVRAKVSTPMLGEVRLQWWRDAIESGEAQGNPLATDLIAMMAGRGLPKQALLDLLEARIFDLYDDAFPTTTDLEGYAGETRGRILSLASAITAPDMPQTGAAADAAGHGGVALLLRDTLLDWDENVRRGQTFVAADMLAAPGDEPTDMPPALRDDVRQRASAHLSAFLLAAEGLPPQARPAYMPAALVGLDLTRGTRAPLWRRLWALRRMARKGVRA